MAPCNYYKKITKKDLIILKRKNTVDYITWWKIDMTWNKNLYSIFGYNTCLKVKFWITATLKLHRKILILLRTYYFFVNLLVHECFIWRSFCCGGQFKSVQKVFHVVMKENIMDAQNLCYQIKVRCWNGQMK